MSVKTEDREWLLDYSHHQADFSKGKKTTKRIERLQALPNRGIATLFLLSLFVCSSSHPSIYHPISEKKLFESFSSQHFSEQRHSKHRTAQFL